MAIYNKNTVTTVDGKDTETLVLEITNGHKETIEKLVKAYRIKGGVFWVFSCTVIVIPTIISLIVVKFVPSATASDAASTAPIQEEV